MLEHDLTCPVRQTRHPTVTELYDSGPDARRPAGQGRAEARLSPVPCRPGAPAGPGTFRARRPTCAALVLTSPSRHSPPPPPPRRRRRAPGSSPTRPRTRRRRCAAPPAPPLSRVVAPPAPAPHARVTLVPFPPHSGRRPLRNAAGDRSGGRQLPSAAEDRLAPAFRGECIR